MRRVVAALLCLLPALSAAAVDEPRASPYDAVPALRALMDWVTLQVTFDHGTATPDMAAGEATVQVVKPGEGEGQGVGYLPDGTMVVIDGALPHVGNSVQAVVTNSLQTSAGRMIFAKLEGASDADGDSTATRMAAAATHQPRNYGRGPRGGSPPEGRNPRRG